MDEYFTKTLDKLNSKNYNELTIVLGNESCDLDSAVSSIVYAIFLTWQHCHCKGCPKEDLPQNVLHDFTSIFVPVLNVNREDYELKTEVAFLLRKYGVNKSQLLFRDDQNLQELVNNSNTKVVLVDHHVLCQKDMFLAPFVTEIIDHRPLDKSQWTFEEGIRTTIETVGSCSTLVGQRIKDLSSLIGTDVDFFNKYIVCGRLLHAAIILDTVNFSKEVNKGTPNDEDIMQFLESLLKPKDYTTERQQILDELVAARSDVSRLTTPQLLRKDLKIVANIYVPSFPILVKEVLKKPDIVQSVNEALVRHGCIAALLLGMDLSGGLKRDAAVYSTKEGTAVMLGEHLEHWTTPPLGLTLTSQEQSSQEFLYYCQMNLTASRKQYIPAINDYIQKYK